MGTRRVTGALDSVSSLLQPLLFMCVNFFSGGSLSPTALLSKCTALLGIRAAFVETCLRDTDAAKQSLARHWRALKALRSRSHTHFDDRSAVVLLNGKVLGNRRTRVFLRSPRHELCRAFQLRVCEARPPRPADFSGKGDLQTRRDSEMDLQEDNAESRETPAKVDGAGEQRNGEVDLVRESEGIIAEVRDEGAAEPSQRTADARREEARFEQEVSEIDGKLARKNLGYLTRDSSSEKAFLRRGKLQGGDGGSSEGQEGGRGTPLSPEPPSLYENEMHQSADLADQTGLGAITDIIGEGNPTETRALVAQSDWESKEVPELERELISAIKDFSGNLADIDFMKKYLRESSAEGPEPPGDSPRDSKGASSKEAPAPEASGGPPEAQAYLEQISLRIARDLDSFSDNLKTHRREPKKRSAEKAAPEPFPIHPEKLSLAIPESLKQTFSADVADSLSKVLDSGAGDAARGPQDYLQLIRKIKKNSYEEQAQLERLQKELLESPESPQKSIWDNASKHAQPAGLAAEAELPVEDRHARPAKRLRREQTVFEGALQGQFGCAAQQVGQNRVQSGQQPQAADSGGLPAGPRQVRPRPGQSRPQQPREVPGRQRVAPCGRGRRRRGRRGAGGRARGHWTWRPVRGRRRGRSDCGGHRASRANRETD